MNASRARLRALAASSLLTLAAIVACGRRAHTPSAPRPTPADTSRVAAPSRADTTKRADTTQRAKTDSTATDSTARVARADSTRRDSTQRDSTRRDSTRRDTTRTARTRRRNADDPTSRCRAVGINDEADRPLGSRLQNLTDASNKAITYVGGGVVARCRGIRNRLQADSAESYEGTGTIFLVNNVVYDEPGRVHLTSARLTYYTNEERLVADGNVVITLPSGTTMVGPNAEYLREAPALRDRSKLTATGRPQVRVISAPQKPTRADSIAKRPPNTTPDTATIIANTIIDEGDSLVFASGQVQILRADVTATSDSATFDQGTELAHLIKSAQIKGKRETRSFTLAGALIDLYSRERELTRVVAKDSGHVTSDDLDLKSDTIDLRVRDSRVERAFAWGPSRAIATSPDRDVIADSIDARLPDQRIRELHAVRRAVARSVPDTTRIASKERDLLAGDTIVALFDTVAAAKDTTRNPPVKLIVADGHASSLYQIASGEGRTSPPGVNYVRGRRIRVEFDSNQVQMVTVTDSASGVYLEPGADTTADSTTNRRGRNAPSRRGGGGGQPIRRPGRPPDETTSAIDRRDRPRQVAVDNHTTHGSEE